MTLEELTIKVNWLEQRIGTLEKSLDIMSTRILKEVEDTAKMVSYNTELIQKTFLTSDNYKEQ